MEIADLEYFEALVRGVVQHADELDEVLSKFIDRTWPKSIRSNAPCCASPASNCATARRAVPRGDQRAIETTKRFGAEHGHTYVNACSTAPRASGARRRSRAHAADMSGRGEFDLIERIKERAASRPDVILASATTRRCCRCPKATSWWSAQIPSSPACTSSRHGSAGHRWKALAVNLSDLAAMAATPAWASLALTLPEADDDCWTISRRFLRVGQRAPSRSGRRRYDKRPVVDHHHRARAGSSRHGPASRRRRVQRRHLGDRHAGRCGRRVEPVARQGPDVGQAALPAGRPTRASRPASPC